MLPALVKGFTKRSALLALCLALTACYPSTAQPTAVPTPEASAVVSPEASASVTPEASESVSTALDPDVPVGMDLTQSLPAGDAERGADLAQSKDCLGCHRNLPVGPLYEPEGEPAIGARAATRIEQPDYHGQATTAEQYLLESIVSPEAYVVEGFPEGLMPDGFSRLLTRQQAADLIAYLSSLK